MWGGLQPLFIVVLGSMGGKSERSGIPAHHGKLSAVAYGQGSANHGECPLTVSHKTTQNPGAYHELLIVFPLSSQGVTGQQYFQGKTITPEAPKSSEK